MSTLSIAAILLYLAFIVYVAWKSSRHETRESFMLADRSLNWGQIAMSMTAGWTSGAVAIGAAAFAYEGAGIMVAFSISVVISLILTGMYLTGTLTDWRAVGVIVFALAFPFIYDVARKTVTPRPNA